MEAPIWFNMRRLAIKLSWLLLVLIVIQQDKLFDHYSEELYYGRFSLDT